MGKGVVALLQGPYNAIMMPLVVNVPSPQFIITGYLTLFVLNSVQVHPNAR
jgi:hypothetical protein